MRVAKFVPIIGIDIIMTLTMTWYRRHDDDTGTHKDNVVCPCPSCLRSCVRCNAVECCVSIAVPDAAQRPSRDGRGGEARFEVRFGRTPAGGAGAASAVVDHRRSTHDACPATAHAPAPLPPPEMAMYSSWGPSATGWLALQRAATASPTGSSCGPSACPASSAPPRARRA